MLRNGILALFLFSLLGHAEAQDEWWKVANAFRSAVSGKDEAKLNEAVERVVRDNSERAATLLIRSLRSTEGPVYWHLISGLSALNSKGAVDAVTAELVSKKKSEYKRDLMMALQRSSSVHVREAFLTILKEGTPDLRLIAIDELVKLGSKEAVPLLIGVVRENEDELTELKRQALKALRALSGTDVGAASGAWQAWWEKNKDSFVVGGGGEGEPAPRSGPGETVAETLKRNRTTDYEDLKRGGEREIVVVTGVWDEVQKVLTRMSIPHTVQKKSEFETFDLAGTHTLLINCDDYFVKKLSDSAIRKIREFVSRGGYLFTSDWGITEVLETAFPGYVKCGRIIGPNLTVDIFPTRGSTGHPFLKEVFVRIKTEGGKDGKSASERVEKMEFQWVIDATSYAIWYDSKKVIVLVESPELKERYKYTAVAVTFLYGDDKNTERQSVATKGGREEIPQLKGGKVLHVLSHFMKQKTKNDEYAIQNMLLNFLIEAKDRRMMRAAPVKQEKKKKKKKRR
ncbi:MAG: HEAT repeat domain-containing protein [Planctomycetota bacterium]|jgi:hypothetical protein